MRVVNLAAKRRYKPVDRKVRPVPTYMPSPEAQFFKPIPLPERTPLPTHPQPFEEFLPTERLTAERFNILLGTIPDDFLTHAEKDLVMHVVASNEAAFAFTFAEKGVFSPEYYPDYEIPTIEHVPWQRPPIRPPKALESVIREEILEQEKAKRFESTTSSYRSALFAVAKKNGVRLVLDLQELNSVTIRDAALPPSVEEFAEAFIGRAIYGSVDLFAGYDARILAKSSRPLTAFHSICGPKQQTTLPMGATNAGAEFQRCINHALQSDCDDTARAFMDDVGIMGPLSTYGDEAIPGNDQIRRYVYEYATTLDRILARFVAAGITASGLKTVLATPRLRIVGTVVSLEGWHLEKGLITKIVNWPACENVSQVRGFLGVAGCGRKWIKGFALIAKPLTQLLKLTDADFTFSEDALQAMNALKGAVTQAPVLTKIDYEKAKAVTQLPRSSDEGLITVAVDAAALHGAGWVVYQQQDQQRKPAIFGSCTYSDRERRYSQPKAELYGVFRAFKHLRHRIWGVRFCLEHDAKFLREMIVSPDLPNSPMTRWIMYLSLFDFEMKHVPGDKHSVPDGLSRRPQSSNDSEEEEPSDEFLDRFIGVALAGHGIKYNPGAPYYLSAPKVKALLRDVLVLRPLVQMASSAPYHAILRRPFGIHDQGNTTAGEQRPIPTRATFGVLTEGQPTNAAHPAAPSKPITVDPNNWTTNHAVDYTLLRATNNMTFVGREFFERNVPVEVSEVFVMGDEEITLPVTRYHYSYMAKLESGAPPPPIIDPEASHHCSEARRADHRGHYEMIAQPETREAIACIGHKFGTRDEEYPGMWKELRLFYAEGALPAACLTDNKERAKFLRRANRYFFSEDRLWAKPHAKSSAPPRLVIEDEERRQQLLREVHDECGHRGRDPTYHKLAERVYWPNMYDDCAYFVRSCVPCQLESRAKPILPYNPSWATSILRHWHMDCVHMPPGHGGKNFLVQATCAASKWEEAQALKRANAASIAPFVYKLVCRFSCIPFITIDGGTEFKGLAEEVYKQFGIVVIVSSAYHPQGNGVSERAHPNLVHGLMKVCHADKSRWPLYVDAILFAIRVTTNRVTGFPPYYLVYGVYPVLAFDIEDGTWQTLDWDTVRDTVDLIALRAKQVARRDADAQVAYERARFSRQKAIDNFNERYGRNFSFHGFDVGMWVLRHETAIDNQFGRKEMWRWSGPYIVHEKRPNNSFVLRELNGVVMKGHVSAHRLKLFFFRDENHILKTVSDVKIYYDIHRFEKTLYSTLRAVSSQQTSRHPDPDYDHYAIPQRASHSHPLSVAPLPSKSPRRAPIRIVYLHGEVFNPVFPAARPVGWGGAICDSPEYEAFAEASQWLFDRVIDDVVGVEGGEYRSTRYPLGFVSR